MTPLPKRRLSTARQGKRRASFMLKSLVVSKCPNCGESYLPHRICANCGYYNGKQVLTLSKKPEEAK